MTFSRFVVRNNNNNIFKNWRNIFLKIYTFPGCLIQFDCFNQLFRIVILIRNLSRYPADSVELPPPPSKLEQRLIPAGFLIIERRMAVPNHLLKMGLANFLHQNIFFCFSLIFLLFPLKRNCCRKYSGITLRLKVKDYNFMQFALYQGHFHGICQTFSRKGLYKNAYRGCWYWYIRLVHQYICGKDAFWKWFEKSTVLSFKKSTSTL